MTKLFLQSIHDGQAGLGEGTTSGQQAYQAEVLYQQSSAVTFLITAPQEASSFDAEVTSNTLRRRNRTQLHKQKPVNMDMPVGSQSQM